MVEKKTKIALLVILVFVILGTFSVIYIMNIGEDIRENHVNESIMVVNNLTNITQNNTNLQKVKGLDLNTSNATYFNQTNNTSLNIS